MPKKEKRRKEKHEKTGEENPEDNEKRPESHEESSELEGELWDDSTNKSSQNFQFQFDTAKLQDLISSKSTAPVLEQVAFSSETRPARRFFAEEEEEEIERSSGSKYIPEANIPEEQKYMGTNASMNVSLQKPDFSEFKRNPFAPNREISQERFSEAHQLGLQSFSMEKYNPPERLEMGKAGRDNVLDKEKKKYEFKASGR